MAKTPVIVLPEEPSEAASFDQRKRRQRLEQADSLMPAVVNGFDMQARVEANRRPGESLADLRKRVRAEFIDIVDKLKLRETLSTAEIDALLDRHQAIGALALAGDHDWRAERKRRNSDDERIVEKARREAPDPASIDINQVANEFEDIVRKFDAAAEAAKKQRATASISALAARIEGVREAIEALKGSGEDDAS